MAMVRHNPTTHKRPGASNAMVVYDPHTHEIKDNSMAMVRRDPTTHKNQGASNAMVVYDHPHEGSHKAVAPFQKTPHHVADDTSVYFDDLDHRLDAIENEADHLKLLQRIDRHAYDKIARRHGQHLDELEAKNKQMQEMLDTLYKQRFKELKGKIEKEDREKEHKKPDSVFRKMWAYGKKPKK